MLDVSDLANVKLNEYMKSNNLSSSLRVAVMQGGCSGPALGLALDEVKDTDESFVKEDLTFLVEKGLLEQCGTISIDYVDAGPRSGFSISSTNPLPGAGDGCNPNSCGSGGCGC